MSTTLRNKLLRSLLLLSIVLSIGFALVPSASANVRMPSGDLPFYTPAFWRAVEHSGDEWTMISFYRPPSCIPPAFNLLDFLDPAAFACTPPTTEGFEIWQDPAVDAVPVVWVLHGLGAVPVYFVNWSELQAAMADGVLTIVELENLPSLLRGAADVFEQKARFEPTGEYIVVHVSARGELEDGRAFRMKLVINADLEENTRIEFR